MKTASPPEAPPRAEVVAGAIDPGPRPTLVFARTERGDEQIRRERSRLPIHLGRLLLLFETPQGVDDLRQMIDAAWLPEALIELERRKLIRRIAAKPPASPMPSAADRSPAERLRAEPNDGPATAAMPMPDDLPPAFVAARERTRERCLHHLGDLGDEMARRIAQCRGEAELVELMPQVCALIEAIAGHAARQAFQQALVGDEP